MEEYNDVFNGGLGRLAGKERLEIDSLVQPVKTPLRRVPLSVQDKLEGKITRLQELGVIEKVEQPTDWVSGLVVAEKRMDR